MRKVECIFMPRWEFEQTIEEIFGKHIEISFDCDGTEFYDEEQDDYIPYETVAKELAKHYGVDHISSMHLNQCFEDENDDEVWICFHNEVKEN